MLSLLSNTYTEKDLELAWSNSLYLNGKVGFSLKYTENVFKEQSFRKYPFAAN